MLKPVLTVSAAVAALALAACSNEPKPPQEAGVCYQVTVREGQPAQYNELARNQPTLEECIARLEEMRRQFLRMGGTRRSVTGVYHGKYLFVDNAGVTTADSLTGGRYFAFARAPDGSLSLPNIVHAPPPAQPPVDAEQK